ncbi:MAG: AI-2E family transporter [Daejeonella sp.]
MSIYSYKQRNIIVLLILVILGCFILYSLRNIGGAILSTIVLYTIFKPFYLLLTEKWGFKKWISATTIIISSLVIIVLPFLALSIMVIDKISDFQREPERIKVIMQKIDAFAGSKLNQPDLVDKGIKKARVFAEELFPSVLGGAAGFVLGLLLMYFLLYFMFVQMEKFERGLLKYSPFSEQNALKFATELKHITYSNVLGQGFIAIVQGALVSLAFFVFGIKDGIFWGVISTFLSFLPVVGAPTVFVPAALIELANGNTTAGWGILLWGFIVIINIDNVIRLMIAKRVADIHPIITVVGVIIGIPIFGILGLVFGPLLLSYFILTIKIYETGKLVAERLERIKSTEDVIE